MEKQKILQQGAEAKIIQQGDFIIKNRIKKSYRLFELDEKLRKSRTKSETKLLEKASNIINVPIPLVDNENTSKASTNFQIKMPFIDGKKLSEYLDSFPLVKQKSIFGQIGKDVAKLHDKNIIHGDLTTSNMILVNSSENNKSNTPNSKNSSSLIVNKSLSDSEGIYLIDFGLSFISYKLEDKAVDLHLLKQALEAKHFQHWKALFNFFIKGYKSSKDADKVLSQLKKVEKRGRYKH